MPSSELLLYRTEDGQTRVQVRLEEETVWLSQKQMAELFQKDVRTINEHLQNVYEEGELLPGATIRNFRIVQIEGSREVEREICFYNLDVVISVGYRVRSHRGTQFRIWATQRLREYIIKGFVLDDQRLKEGGRTDAYFDELLERVRDIRTSEWHFYRKVCEIYATSVDYEPSLPMTQDFFATVQNKFHYAIHGHTAAELIAERAKAEAPNMGLTTWKGAKPRKADAAVAKNYLGPEELGQLNLIVEQYLAFAELQARSRKPMTMQDWIGKLHGFLQLNDREILKGAGRITHELAKELAEAEYSKFDAKRRIESVDDSEFDRQIKRIEALAPKAPQKKRAK